MRVAVLSRWGSFKSDESIARAVHTTASPDHLPLRIELEAMGALVRARNTRSSTRTRGAPLEGGAAHLRPTTDPHRMAERLKQRVPSLRAASA